MITNLKSDERLDDLQINGYEIIQHPGKFCFGMDAVLLANFARVKQKECALDLGTGTGSFPFYLRQRPKGCILPDWRYRKKVLTWQEEA